MYTELSRNKLTQFTRIISLQPYIIDLPSLIMTPASKMHVKFPIYQLKNKIDSAHVSGTFFGKNCKSEFCFPQIVNDSDFRHSTL